MQNEVNEANQSGCIQNDPVLEKLFEDAIDVLRLAGADDDFIGHNKEAEKSHQESQLQKGRSRKEKRQPQQKNEKKLPVITKSKRRKLERIKAPVIVLRKKKQDKVPSEEEQESSVTQMLSYINRLPSQETFQPPPLPFVSLSTDENNDKADFMEDEADSSESIQDYTYLSSEKDVTVWKMLVESPNNCNVFVGGLSHNLTSEILHTAFEAFIFKAEEKDQLKAHVVMDTARHQTKGYGFVNFPCRRSAELALICMQDFEIHGRAMQLGWGQENREEKLSNAEDCRVKNRKQLGANKRSEKSKGNVVSDTVYPDAGDRFSKQPLKRCSLRWDEKTPVKYQRKNESTVLEPSQGCLAQLNEACQLALSSSSEQQDNSPSMSNKNLGFKSIESPRKPGIQWLTHGQKVALLKAVCSNLRAFGVRGHIGVFGLHYEADNSRLYVVCAKHVTDSQLVDEFSVFGTSQVKLNTDSNGFSKGCAFVQFTDGKCAEKAIKQLHGKVVGGMPMKVMVAEPKVRKGLRMRKHATQLREDWAEYHVQAHAQSPFTFTST